MTLSHLPQIFFIRHGQTAWNAEKRYQGRKDIPLDDIGRGQADANGPFLAMLLNDAGLDPNECRWIASPMIRARETAQRVRAAFDEDLPELAFDERLVEISYGELEGQLQADLTMDQMPPHGTRDESFWYSRPTGGESFDDVTERVRAVIHEIDRPTVMVAHGGIVRVMRHIIEDAKRVDVVNWPVPQDGIMRFVDGHMTFVPNPALTEPAASTRVGG